MTVVHGSAAVVEYLGTRDDAGFTPSDKRYARHLATHGPYQKKVSQRLCEEIRRRRHNGVSAETVHEDLPVELTRSGMDAHAAGRCTHPSTVPPVEAYGHLSQVQCALLRMACWRGLTQREVAELPAEPVDQSTVHHHVSGQCRHLCGVPAVKQETVSAVQCQYWRRRRRRGDAVECVAADTAFSASTVSKHTNGDCGHDVTGGESRGE